MGAFFLQTSRILRLVSTLTPLHIVIHSQTCSTRVAVHDTPFSPKNLASVEIAHAWVLPITVHHFEVIAHRIDLCGGRALRGMAVDLNRVYARHR